MAVEKDNAGRYAWGGVVVLCLLILLGWFAFHGSSPPPTQPTAKIELPKPQARRAAPAFEPADDLTNEEMVAQTDSSTITNAADLYRQAFALFEALSKDQQFLLGGWRTNVDASLETEMCDKLRPICDLLHQASTVTNCDWGIEPITIDTKFTHLTPARSIARTAIWSAAHCRSNDVAGATDDLVGVLRLGQQVSRSAMIGCLVDMALQGLASSYVVQNIGSFRGAEGQRLAAILDDQAYKEEPSRAIYQDAGIAQHQADKLAAMSEAELKKNWPGDGANPAIMDRPTVLAQYQQIADLERGLAKALADSSEAEYEAWKTQAAQIQSSNPLGATLATFDNFLDKVQSAEVNRALVVAGMAVAQGGADTLTSHPDPSSGQPFVYTKTADGFDLQSTYQVNGKPMMMHFK